MTNNINNPTTTESGDGEKKLQVESGKIFDVLSQKKEVSEIGNIIQEAKIKIKEKYNDFSSLLLGGKNEAFHVLRGIRMLEKIYSDIGIQLDPIKTIDDFITEEMKEKLKQEYLYNPRDFDKLEFIYKLGDPTPEEQFSFFKAYCLQIADPSFENNRDVIAKFINSFKYTLTRETAGDLFVAIAEKTKSAYGTVYELSHIFERKFSYISITKNVAEILSSPRSKLYRNGKTVSHEELKNILAQEKIIYFYSQHSYYGTLFLGNRVIEK